MPSTRASHAVNDLIDDIEPNDDYSFDVQLDDYRLRLNEPYWVNASLFSKVTLVDPRTRRSMLSAKIDLVDLVSRERLNRQLDFFCNDGTWPAIISQFFARVVHHIAQADAPVRLSEVVDSEEERFIEVAGFPLLLNDPTILFADGGAKKSLLALWWAAQVSQKGIPALYLDWEMRAKDHKERLTTLFPDEEFANLWYLSARAPLAVIEDSLRAYIAQNKIEFLVVDSAAPAAATEGADIPTEFFGVLRRLECGALILAHMNRLKDTEKPFGSAFWHNYARASWYLEANPDSTLTLYNRKNSFGGIVPHDPKYGQIELSYKVSRLGEFTAITTAKPRTFDLVNPSVILRTPEAE